MILVPLLNPKFAHGFCSMLGANFGFGALGSGKLEADHSGNDQRQQVIRNRSADSPKASMPTTMLPAAPIPVHKA
jgi:hypothetical protein